MNSPSKQDDLTGNYTTAFNLGKQQEVEMRVKHAHFKKE